MNISELLEDFRLVFNEKITGLVFPENGPQPNAVFNKSYVDNVLHQPFQKRVDKDMYLVVNAIVNNDIKTQQVYGKHKLNTSMGISSFAYRLSAGMILVISFSETNKQGTLEYIGTHKQIPGYHAS